MALPENISDSLMDALHNVRQVSVNLLQNLTLDWVYASPCHL